MVKKYYLVLVAFLAGQMFLTLPLWADILPAHPKISKTAQQNMLVNGVNIQTAQYNSILSEAETLDFYRNKLAAEGWKIEFDTYERGTYLMVFSNDKKETLGVDVYPGQAGQGCVVAGTYSWGVAEPPTENKDVSGRDLPWFNRYAGALRTMDMEWERGKTLMYVNKQSDFNLVVDFSRQQLLSSGWQLQGENILSGENMLDIYKRLPDNIKMQMQGLESDNINIEKQATLLFTKGNKLAMISVALVNGQVATTVNYIVDYRKEN